MRTLIIGTAALVLTLSACGDDDGEAASSSSAPLEETSEESTPSEEPSSEEDLPPSCSEQYAEGAVVAAEDVDAGCVEDDGTLWFGGAAETECADGRVLKWNDRAWWYEGEGVHPHAPNAEEQVAPLEEREACQP